MMYLTRKEIREKSGLGGDDGIWVEGIFIKKYHPLGSFISESLHIDGQQIISITPSIKLKELRDAKEGLCRIRLCDAGHLDHGYEKQEIFFDRVILL